MAFDRFVHAILHPHSCRTRTLCDHAVDLLFDEDTAFWPALAQVSQKAKCPIVLTATSVPDELVKNFKFKSISLARPLPQECATKMAMVSESEGMRFQEDVPPEEQPRRLLLIAEICQCDIRKILNEMQLFHFAEKPRSRDRDKVKWENFGLPLNNAECSSSPTEGTGVVGDRPLILSVEPKVVPRDRHSLITITGKNFSWKSFPSRQSDAVAPTTLLIGGKQCSHFHVASEDMILAVCPPCVLPNGVSKDAIYNTGSSKAVDCLTGIFPAVVVRKRCSNGLILDSNSRIGLENSDEFTSWNVEYDIPLRDSVFEQKKLLRDEFIRQSKERLARENMADNVDEDRGFLSSPDNEEIKKEKKLAALDGEDEDELKNDDFQTMGNLPEVKEPGLKDIDPQTLLDEAISGTEAYEAPLSTEASLSAEGHPMPRVEVDQFADELERLSDAVLLEDSFTMMGIPALSGSVEGFGGNAIESLSTTDPLKDQLSKGKNTKP